MHGPVVWAFTGVGVLVALATLLVGLQHVSTQGWRGAARAEEIADARLHLLSAEQRPHVDPASGLAVRWFTSSEPEPYIAAWNDVVRRRVAAGAAAPTYLDRVVDVETMRDRFARDGARTIAIERGVAVIGRWWVHAGGDRLLAWPGAEGPGCTTGIPDVPIGDDVRALVVEDGRAIWLQGRRADGTETYAVIDAERGWVVHFAERAPR